MGGRITREIKFRAWLKEDKRMVNVETMDFTDKSMQYLEKSEIINAYLLRRVIFDDVELMQFTGVKDKNDKEIYEGDIYHVGDKNIRYLVVWFDSGFEGKQLRSTSYAGLKSWAKDIEVLGNIYENFELLENNND